MGGIHHTADALLKAKLRMSHDMHHDRSIQKGMVLLCVKFNTYKVYICGKSPTKQTSCEICDEVPGNTIAPFDHVEGINL